MHSSGMRTVRSSSRLSRGGLPQCMLRYQPPPGSSPSDQAPPWERSSPLEADRPRPGTPWEQTPQTRHPTPWRPVARHAGIPPAMHAGISPPWRPAARHAGIPLARQGMLGYHTPPVDRHTPVKT